MTFRRSNQKPRTKKSHVMEQIFLSPVTNTKNNQRIREKELHKQLATFKMEELYGNDRKYFSTIFLL